MTASGNRLGRATVQTINTEAYRSLRYIGEPTRTDCTDSNVAHQAVFDRIAAKDEKGAAEAMSDHILGSWLRRRPDTRGRSSSGKRADADHEAQ
jgi:DNA-binding GntR family transcriptional regulator